MKGTFKIIVTVLLAIIYGCQKNEIIVPEPKPSSPSNYNSITSDGVISGTIVNDSTSLVDSIKVYSGGLIGKDAVSAVGKFSVTLTVPTLHRYIKLSGVAVSDSMAMIGNVYEIQTHKAGCITSIVQKSNYSADSLGAGMFHSIFIYSDRAFTIVGTHTYSPNTSEGITHNSKENWKVTIKKGWTEIIDSIDSYSKTSNTETISHTYSSTIPSDLKWKCSYSVISNANSSITDNGTICGTIMNYSSNQIDTLNALGLLTNVYGNSAFVYMGGDIISSLGKFSFGLTTPSLSKTHSSSSIVISDPAVMTGSVYQIMIGKNGYGGCIARCNFDYNGYLTIKSGMSYSQFTYSDRPFTMKGVSSLFYSAVGLTLNYKDNYNLTFKKGWNEIIVKEDYYSSTINGTTEYRSFSNNITNDLQWRLFSLPPSIMRSKAQRDHVKTELLFR